MAEIPTTSGAGARSSFEIGDEVPQELPGASEWRLFLVLGIISILFGVAVIAWPDATLRVMAVMVGLWLLGAGIARVLSAFLTGQRMGQQILSGIIGLLLIVGGVACLRDLANGAVVLAFMVALTWLFSGLAGIAAAFETDGSHRVWLLVLGIASMIVGLVFLIVPELSLAVLVWLTGLSAIVIGIGESLVAFLMRGATRQYQQSVAAGREAAAGPAIP